MIYRLNTLVLSSFSTLTYYILIPDELSLSLFLHFGRLSLSLMSVQTAFRRVFHDFSINAIEFIFRIPNYRTLKARENFKRH